MAVPVPNKKAVQSLIEQDGNHRGQGLHVGPFGSSLAPPHTRLAPSFEIRPNAFFPVYVEKVSGANGTSNSAATYLYTLRSHPDGITVLVTNTAQIRPREWGAVTFQTGSTSHVGVAFPSGSNIKLWDAGEIPGMTNCT